MWYLCSRFCITSSETFFSLENGPPGATLMMKKLNVTIKNSVGIKLSRRLMINLHIRTSWTKEGGAAHNAPDGDCRGQSRSDMLF